MLKYSLGTLFLVVAVVAVGCAAAANFSPLWAEVMIALTLMILSIALVAALVGRGRTRVFAVGFAAVGWMYFLLTFVDAVGLRNERLLTSRAIHWLYGLKQQANAGAATTAPPTAVDFGMPGGGMPSMSGSGMGPMGAGDASMGMEGMGGDMSGMMGMGSMPGGMGIPVLPVTYFAPRELQDIGHSLWTLLLGAAAGMLARAIHGAGRQEDAG
jgi:hypothetical protein